MCVTFPCARVVQRAGSPAAYDDDLHHLDHDHDGAGSDRGELDPSRAGGSAVARRGRAPARL